MPKKFDKPLNREIEEEREVIYPKFSFGKDGKPKLEQGTKVIKERVKYVEMGGARKFSCNDGQHQYFMLDRHKHIAKCENCTKHRYLRAAYETIKFGHIIDRETNTIID